MSKANARHEQLIADLDVAKAISAIESYGTSNPTGNKLLWTIKAERLAQDHDGSGELHELTLATPEAEAFVAGVYAGRAGQNHGGGRRKPNPIRDSIETHGHVVVTLEDPTDAAEQKRVRNKVFTAAYTLGHKGAFKVRSVDGKVYGWRTDADEDLTPEPVKESQA